MTAAHENRTADILKRRGYGCPICKLQFRPLEKTAREYRQIFYPETETAVAPHVYRSFLDNRDLAGIFSYYRILRKLEYLLKAAADEAGRRATHEYRES